jgi:hypothetical protein
MHICLLVAAHRLIDSVQFAVRFTVRVLMSELLISFTKSDYLAEQFNGTVQAAPAVLDLGLCEEFDRFISDAVRHTSRLPWRFFLLLMCEASGLFRMMQAKRPAQCPVQTRTVSSSIGYNRKLCTALGQPAP